MAWRCSALTHGKLIDNLVRAVAGWDREMTTATRHSAPPPFPPGSSWLGYVWPRAHRHVGCGPGVVHAQTYAGPCVPRCAGVRWLGDDDLSAAHARHDAGGPGATCGAWRSCAGCRVRHGLPDGWWVHAIPTLLHHTTSPAPAPASASQRCGKSSVPVAMVPTAGEVPVPRGAAARQTGR